VSRTFSHKEVENKWQQQRNAAFERRFKPRPASALGIGASQCKKTSSNGMPFVPPKPATVRASSANTHRGKGRNHNRVSVERPKTNTRPHSAPVRVQKSRSPRAPPGHGTAVPNASVNQGATWSSSIPGRAFTPTNQIAGERESGSWVSSRPQSTTRKNNNVVRIEQCFEDISPSPIPSPSPKGPNRSIALEKAAVRMQASFRGRSSRSKLRAQWNLGPEQHIHVNVSKRTPASLSLCTHCIRPLQSPMWCVCIVR
jgi:hypothetical protein